MTQKEYNNICKMNLHKKKESILHRVERDTPSVEDAGMVFSTEYHRFLEYATELDIALKLGQWENADEITDTLMDLPPFKDNLRYIAIVGKLLEEYNV